MRGPCAICVEETELVADTELEPGRTLWVCRPCRDEHPRSGRYAIDFGSTAQPAEKRPGRRPARTDRRKGQP